MIALYHFTIKVILLPLVMLSASSQATKVVKLDKQIPEIVGQISSHLDLKDAQSLASTSKKMATIVGRHRIDQDFRGFDYSKPKIKPKWKKHQSISSYLSGILNFLTILGGAEDLVEDAFYQRVKEHLGPDAGHFLSEYPNSVDPEELAHLIFLGYTLYAPEEYFSPKAVDTFIDHVHFKRCDQCGYDIAKCIHGGADIASRVDVFSNRFYMIYNGQEGRKKNTILKFLRSYASLDPMDIACLSADFTKKEINELLDMGSELLIEKAQDSRELVSYAAAMTPVTGSITSFIYKIIMPFIQPFADSTPDFVLVLCLGVIINLVALSHMNMSSIPQVLRKPGVIIFLGVLLPVLFILMTFFERPRLDWGNIDSPNPCECQDLVDIIMKLGVFPSIPGIDQSQWPDIIEDCVPSKIRWGVWALLNQ